MQKTLFLISVSLISFSLSGCAEKNSAQDSINKGCLHIKAAEKLVIEENIIEELLKAAPYFAEAARKDGEYLILLEKQQNSRWGDRIGRLKARAWLNDFCEGSL